MTTTLLNADQAMDLDAVVGEEATRGRWLFLVIQVILLLAALTQYMRGLNSMEAVPMLVVLGTLVAASQYVYHLSSRRPVDWLSADLLFLFGFYVVHFGYPLLWSLGVAQDTKMNIWWNPLNVPAAMCLAIMGLASFCIGYNLIRVPARYARVPLVLDEEVLLFWRKFGLAVTIPAFVVLVAFQIMYHGETENYGEAFRSRGSFGVASVLFNFSYIFLRTGLAFAFVSAFLLRKEFRPGALATSIWIIAGVMYLVTGARMQAGIIFLTGLVAFSTFYRRIRLPWLLGMVALAGAVFGAAGIARHIAFGSVGGLATVVQEQFDPLSAYEEMMGSFRTVVVAFDVRNEHGLFYGAAWVPATLGIVPFGGQLTPGFLQAAAFGKSYWISQIIAPGNDTNSAGTTVIADSFLEFGLLGVIGISFLVGMVAAYFWRKVSISGSIGWAVGYVGMASALAAIARFEYHDFLRPAIWPLIMTALVARSGIASRYLWPASGNPPAAPPQS